MTLVLPAYTPSMPSARLGEDHHHTTASTVFSAWNNNSHRNIDNNNKEATPISGGLSGCSGRERGATHRTTSSAIDTASLLQQLAKPKPGYTSLSPDNLIAGTRPGCGTPIPVGMCGTTSGPCLMGSPPTGSSSSSCNSHCERTTYSRSASPLKRKLTLLTGYNDGDDDGDVTGSDPRPKRISPFHNTPKQRRDEKRRVLKMSIQKLRSIDDPEQFLRRSVLINNMTKRMQKELREEKRYGYGYSQTYYPSTFASYADCSLVEQDCFYSSLPPAHIKRLNSCSYMDTDCESSAVTSSSSSHLPSSPSSLACSTTHHLEETSDSCKSNSSNSGFIPSDYSSTDASDMFCEDCDVDVVVPEEQKPIEKQLADDLPESLIRSMCVDTDDVHSHLDPDYLDQDMDSCASLSDSGSEGSSPPASPPSDSDESPTKSPPSSNYTELDRQILGEMDIVFNNLISVLSEA